MEQTSKEEDRKKHEEYDEYAAQMVRIVSKPFARWLIQHTNITPNQMSLLSIVPLITAAFFLAFGGYRNTITGAVLAFCYLILDATDGPLARGKNMTSDLGTWLDGIIGFLALPALMLSMAIGLKSYFALLVGAIAALCFPLHFLFVHFYKSEVVGTAERLNVHVPSKLRFLKSIYGAILFYSLLLFGALLGGTFYVLLFFAVFGTFFWIFVLFIEFFNLKAKKSP